VSAVAELTLGAVAAPEVDVRFLVRIHVNAIGAPARGIRRQPDSCALAARGRNRDVGCWHGPILGAGRGVGLRFLAGSALPSDAIRTVLGEASRCLQAPGGGPVARPPPPT
jgi:hypothetical protein